MTSHSSRRSLLARAVRTTAVLGAALTVGLASAQSAKPVRILVGSLIDRVGIKKLFIVLFTLQVATIIALYPAGQNTMLLALCAGLIGWNYGAMFTLFPATLLQYYGSSAQGSNYGMLFTAWGVAGFCGPFLGGKLQVMTGSFLVPFMVAAAIVGVAALILMTLKAPEKKPA